MKKYKTYESKQTYNLGKNFSKDLKKGDVLLLYGDLGSGKTTFVQGLAKGLGVKDRILSPTFILHRRHDVAKRDFNLLNHIDLYRIEKPEDLKTLGLDEIFADISSITAVEWADRLKSFKVKKGYKIYFKYLGENKREITIDIKS
ncbi:MAG: hypothetical protein US96_C0017G0014 [Candidatus Woesebacteria bacterium GW2011_GWB1_38_5b]|uniref:tRNA threonylcarbamoyladenosine biosynthesis protein TsaE n=1 Tax=Candidatus Woesebacteria bacterium GW2011_GWB1_38_5b TaxID=1618569 RepID=A0A0G0K619_9BACT|nr:MAG: hypothetical protein US96_C0017G0014 [Candidatus Woesebacteria bacterium GW2011_GWB1_38_5b]OGH48103.1 MAG: tRNA (adenosine(37)-N6)-threonylcarbamoyltransferase complex ATPase subunit type 1 TsaE [Candidatus Levybacteria bacterium RIFCSPLOWO2_01_FULL_39_10]